MASLDALPPDQRAVLQLVLQRGRGYDEIADMLAIDRAAVRQRALAGFDALGPQTRVPGERRALITDYLLGQLPPRVAEQVRDRLAQSASERAWARVIAAELAPLATHGLPEIPVETARRAPEFDAEDYEDADDRYASAEAPTGGAAAAAATTPTAAAERAETPQARRAPTESQPPSLVLDLERAQARARARTAPPAAPEREGLGRRSPLAEAPVRRSSRRGGAILLGIVALAIVAAIVIVASSGGSSSHSHSATGSASTPAGTTGATSTPGTTTTTAGQPKIVAQINLKPPGGGRAAGIAEVLKQGGNTGIAIIAQGIAPNSTRPPNAYAVWLYNSASDSLLLGFVNPGVGKNGRLSTAGGLPANASHYHELIVTLETQNKPRSPGRVILAGSLTGV